MKVDAATRQVAVSEERLRETVRTLSVELFPRSYRHVENLDRAAAWIAAGLRASGLAVTEQEYRLAEGVYRNVIGRRAGTDPSAGLLVIGAHYDAYGELPGADDNASGVAVLLELARTLSAAPARQDQLLVAFSTEEPPFFSTEHMGSARFARSLLEAGARVDLMIALDLVGYFSDEAGSQRFPILGLGLVYPNRGDFIAVVGDLGSGGAISRVKRGMLAARSIPVYSFRGPSFIPGVHWSDHLPFRRRGIPAVLLTDTAFLRNPNYHRATDTPDTLDYHRMAGVVRALHGVLAERESE